MGRESINYGTLYRWNNVYNSVMGWMPNCVMLSLHRNSTSWQKCRQQFSLICLGQLTWWQKGNWLVGFISYGMYVKDSIDIQSILPKDFTLSTIWFLWDTKTDIFNWSNDFILKKIEEIYRLLQSVGWQRIFDSPVDWINYYVYSSILIVNPKYGLTNLTDERDSLQFCYHSRALHFETAFYGDLRCSNSRQWLHRYLNQTEVFWFTMTDW